MSSRARQLPQAADRRNGRPDEDGAQRGSEAAAGRLSPRGYLTILKRAVRSSIDDQIPDSAAAVAYYMFLALPAVLLISVGIFGIFAGPSAIQQIVEKLGTVIPPEATALIEDALHRTTQEGSGLTLVIVGGIVALWTASGAANALMRALNRVYEREDSRGFVKQRLVGLAMVLVSVLAFALVFALLVLGPKLSEWIGNLIGAKDALQLIWLIGEWPILIAGLLLAFATALFLGPDRERRWRFLSVSSVLAVLLWLATSAGFALFVAYFGSYNKTWGSLAAVIVMLTWLWLSALTLLFAAEVDAEAERFRDERIPQGAPAPQRG